MPAPSFRAADYVAALQALQPRGRAWQRDPDSTQTKVLNGLAPAFERSNARANQLLVDAFPATSYELLGEWESTLGLPNVIYSGMPSTTMERQSQVVAALTDTGGQSIAYFVGLAATLGYTITITQFSRFTVRSPVNALLYGQAWAHAWQVNAPLINLVEFDMNSDVNEALANWSNATLEAVFRRYGPAHTIVLFVYT